MVERRAEFIIRESRNLLPLCTTLHRMTTNRSRSSTAPLFHICLSLNVFASCDLSFQAWCSKISSLMDNALDALVDTIADEAQDPTSLPQSFRGSVKRRRAPSSKIAGLSRLSGRLEPAGSVCVECGGEESESMAVDGTAAARSLQPKRLSGPSLQTLKHMHSNSYRSTGTNAHAETGGAEMLCAPPTQARTHRPEARYERCQKHTAPS